MTSFFVYFKWITNKFSPPWPERSQTITAFLVLAPLWVVTECARRICAGVPVDAIPTQMLQKLHRHSSLKWPVMVASVFAALLRCSQFNATFYSMYTNSHAGHRRWALSDNFLQYCYLPVTAWPLLELQQFDWVFTDIIATNVRYCPWSFRLTN